MVYIRYMEIKHMDNPRYSADETGQWWYQPQGASKRGYPWPRIRAFVKTCDVCGLPFLWQARTRHNATKNRGTFCSVKCANRSPDKAQGAPKGSEHCSWKGGRRENEHGYVLIWIPDHPSIKDKANQKYVPEHRLVMEQTLGRPLGPFEEVHHRNAIRNDNRPENLELWVKRQPRGARAKDLIEYARWILETYGTLEDKL